MDGQPFHRFGKTGGRLRGAAPAVVEAPLVHAERESPRTGDGRLATDSACRLLGIERAIDGDSFVVSRFRGGTRGTVFT